MLLRNRFMFVLLGSLFFIALPASAEPVVDKVGLALDNIFASAPQVVTAKAVGTYSECGKGTMGISKQGGVAYTRTNGHFVPTNSSITPGPTCSTYGATILGFEGALYAADTKGVPVAGGGIVIGSYGVAVIGAYAYTNYLTGKSGSCFIPQAILGCQFY